MSFDICSSSTTLPERLFVEASAGTGKTFFIEHYITRSILSGSFDPKQLVLITFTKAVARELRLRLKKTLESTQAILRRASSDNIPDYLTPFLNLGSFECRKIARHVDEALDLLPEATISTIHGFCDHLLELWDEEEGQGVISEWMSHEQQREWLRDFLNEGAFPHKYEQKAIQGKYWYRQQALVDLLISSLDEHFTDDTAWSRTSEALELVREQVDTSQIEEALSLRASLFRGNMTKDGSLKKEQAKAFSAIQRLIKEGLTDETLFPIIDIPFAEFFATPLKNAAPLQSDRIGIVIEKTLWPALQELVSTDRILYRLQTRASRSFQQYISATNKKTPGSVIQKVADLSADKAFQTLASEAVSWLIVDEFQDTDATQYRILQTLFLNNPSWKGRVLFVGDPKQAIYSFRKADVYSYLMARDSMKGGETKTLSVNYRSLPQVVEAQNALFTAPALFELPQIGSFLDVPESSSGRSQEPFIDDGRGAIHLCLCRDALGRKRRWPHNEMEQTALFPWIADEMISLFEKGVEFSKQAVLVKDRYQAERIQKFLESRNIPTCAWRSDTINTSLMADWLSKALYLAIRPHDQLRLSALLMAFPTPRHSELCHEMASKGRLDEWASCANAWKVVSEAFYSRGISAFARELFLCRWNGAETVQTWISKLPNGRSHLVDIEHLLDLLALLEDKIPRSLEAYKEALDHLPEWFSNEPELLTKRTDPNDAGVPILTMHRSKGLEFDVVYALGSSSRTPLQDDEHLSETNAEKIRQLYVTVTRAKRRCYIPLLLDNDNRKAPASALSPMELLCLKHTSGGHDSLDIMEALIKAPSFFKKASCSISCSDLREEILHRKAPLLKTAPNIFDETSTVGYTTRAYTSFSNMSNKRELFSTTHCSKDTITGTFFHEAICRLLSAPEYFLESPDTIEAWGAFKNQRLCQMLYNAIHVVLPLKTGPRSLASIPRSSIRTECSFLDTADEPSAYLRGAIDVLLFVDGYTYIIDWKTHDVEETESLINESYSLQASMYQKAVEKAFPSPFGGFFFVFVRRLPEGIVCR